jgi:hypothetical protein
MSEIAALPELATTRTTDTCLVGGRIEVDPGGGSWRVVVVDVVVDVVVEVVVDVVVSPGIVVDVVVEVVVDVVVEVVVDVLAAGSPVIRTTGGSRVTAMITRSSCICSVGALASWATHAAADVAFQDAGSATHVDSGSRPLSE